jgi:hypothetical protein
MHKAGVISDYLESLADALSFDPPLSRSVREEVEDHLREAVAADPIGDRIEAERRAVANFGDPRVIAAQFAIVSLARQIRRAGVLIILVIVSVFATMKARVAWYGLTQWAISDETRAIGGIVGLIDRYAFWLSVVVGIGGLAYIRSRRTPQVFSAEYRKQLRRCFLLCAAAAALVFVSVICDGVLTTLRLLGSQSGAQSLIPIFLMAVELLCAAMLAFQVRGISQRTTFTSVLSKT